MSTIKKFRNYRNRRNAALAARIVGPTGHIGTAPMTDTMRDEMMYLRMRIM